ncbi:MAG: hypothetical protein HC871_17065, partial [Rhizobiales bacterium]|nr:hypothetical protein [Hyphomicrobiales bacterium]
MTETTNSQGFVNAPPRQKLIGTKPWRSVASSTSAALAPTFERPTVALVGRSDLPIWGLTTRQRLRRILDIMRVDTLLEDGEPLPSEGSVLLIRADHALEDRLIGALIEHGPGAL